MDGDEEATRRREELLFEEEMRKREEELLLLEEMRSESGFAPRKSLARTPPQRFSTPFNTPQHQHSRERSPPLVAAPLPGEKRALSSPEDVQEALRRKVQSRKALRIDVAAPPICGLLTTTPTEDRTERTKMEVDELTKASVETLTGIATASTRGIMKAARDKASRLNKDEVAAIGAHTERLTAVVAHLAMRLAAAEAKLEAPGYRPPVATPTTPMPARTSYAETLKLPTAKPALAIERKGPAVLFYPNSDNIKSSDQTKKELQEKVRPAAQGIQIQAVRRVGNAGIVVQTASTEAAKRLKDAAPSTLKSIDPRVRRPLVAVGSLSSDPTFEELINDLHRVNLAEDPAWPLSKLKEDSKLAFKKGRKGGRTTVVLECTKELRDKLVGLGKVYIGWDAAEAWDFVRVTCCMRCQQYGHPEKHCKAASMICGRCGEAGHKASECQVATQCCATCKRFKRPEAHNHRTAARECPARIYAERRSINETHYG